MTQYLLLCGIILHNIAVCYSMSQYVTVFHSMLQYVTLCEIMLQYVALCDSLFYSPIQFYNFRKIYTRHKICRRYVAIPQIPVLVGLRCPVMLCGEWWLYKLLLTFWIWVVAKLCVLP